MEFAQRHGRLVVRAILQQVECRLVLRFRAAGSRLLRRGSGERRLGRAQARVEVDVLVALLGPGALELVLQLVDLAAQRAQLAVQELDLAGHLEQSLVRQLALHGVHAGLEQVEALALRLRVGRRRREAREQAGRNLQ